MRAVKECEHGVRFTQTAAQIHDTITERILLEDIDGCRFLEKVITVLNYYVEFNLMEALKTYGELRASLVDFVDLVHQDQESTEIRVKTWDKIVSILDMLAAEGVQFVGIVAESLSRIE